MKTKRRWKRLAAVIFVALPVALYWVLAAQFSWRPRTLATLNRHLKASWVAFSPDGNSISVAATTYITNDFFDYIDEVSLWSVSEGKRLWHKAADGYGPGVFTPDGRTIALNGERMQLWDVNTGILKGTRGSGGFTCLTAYKHLVVEGSNACSVYVWDMSRPRAKTPVASLGSDEDYSYTIGFSPDGKTLAVGGRTGVRSGVKVTNVAYIRLWDTRTWKLRRLCTGFQKTPSLLAFSPRGQQLVSWSPGEINWWNPNSGQRWLHVTVGSELNNYGPTVFSPDTETIAIGSGKAITLRDTHTGRLQRTLFGHQGTVNSLSFSPDGTTLVSGSDDSTVRLWRIR